MRVVYRLLALLLGVVFAVGAAEGGLRVFRLAPTGGIFTVDREEFERVPGIFTPDRRVVDRRNAALPHVVTTGSLGYRGADFPAVKEPGELRVFFTGDSFVFGDFVDDDETLPARLERELDGRCGRVRVINGGLGGSTIVDQIELVRRGLSLDPDLVVLLFSENDVQDLGNTPLWEQLARNREAKSRPPFSLVYPVVRETALWNLALKATATRRVRGAVPRGDAGQETGDAAASRLRQRYREHLIALRDTLRARGTPLAYVVYPSHLTLNGSWSGEQVRWAEATATGAGIPTVGLEEPLVRSGLPETELYLLPHDGHPGPRGYAIAAEHLARRLVKDGILPRACLPEA